MPTGSHQTNPAGLDEAIMRGDRTSIVEVLEDVINETQIKAKIVVESLDSDRRIGIRVCPPISFLIDGKPYPPCVSIEIDW